MTKFMQIVLASFGVLALMLAGCTKAVEEETSTDTSSDAMTTEEAAPAVEAEAAVEATK